MKRASNRRVGCLRSKELTALSWPLSVLLVLLFSLTIHINAAIAAGGESSICAATRAISSTDNNLPSQQLQMEHCGICIVSMQYKSFGLQSYFVKIDRDLENKPVSIGSYAPDILEITRYSHIRAPPVS